MPDLNTFLNTLSDIGAFGVTLFVVWALMTERLVPKARLDALQKEFDRVRQERDREREARLRREQRLLHERPPDAREA